MRIFKASHLAILLLLMLCTPAISACTSLTDDSETTSDQAETPKAAATLAAATKKEGRITINMTKPDDDLMAQYKPLLTVNKQIVAALNETFVLPCNLKVKFVNEENDNGIHYSPSDKEIIVPYPCIVEDRENMLALEDKKTKKVINSANETACQAASYSLLHEMAHAFIDIYDLPVPGNEEDAADDMAGYLLFMCLDDDKTNDQATDIMQSWFQIFFAMAVAQQGGETAIDPFSDPNAFSSYIAGEHNNSFRRGFNVVKEALAIMTINMDEKDTEEFLKSLLEEDNSWDLLDPEDLQEGVISSLRSLRAWNNLMSPHMRQ